MEKKEIAFNKFYKLFNLISIFLVLISIILLIFKGLNYGVDFKGGTLIELRAKDSQINITNLRESLLNMKLGDVSVKQFGNENDFLIKFEKRKKSVGVYALLAVLLGGLGAHKFYMGKIGIGIIYLLLCWCFVPAVIALIEALFSGSTVNSRNKKIGQEIYQEILMLNFIVWNHSFLFSIKSF